MTNDQLLFAYRHMLLAREFDNALINLYRQSKIVGGVYAQMGNEATSVGTAMALGVGDIIFPMHRDNGAHFVRGMTAREMAINFLFREGSMTRGTDGTGHFAAPDRGIYGNVSHLGAMVPVAAGAALAQQLKGTKNVVMNYIGDGGSSVGEVHEGLVMASTMKLPFILIIENNQYAYSTPVRKQLAAQDFAARAQGYGMPGVKVDGTDIEAVFAASEAAVKRARNGEGPTLIESVTMRMRGHAEHDPFDYVSKELLGEWEKKDPIAQIESVMKKRKIASKAMEGERTKVVSDITEAIEFALSKPGVDPQEAFKNVFVS